MMVSDRYLSVCHKIHDFDHLTIFIRTHYLVLEISFSIGNFNIKTVENTYICTLGTSSFTGPGYTGGNTPSYRPTFMLHYMVDY